MPTKSNELLVRAEALPSYVLESLKLNPKTTTVVELSPGGELYGLVCAHLIKSGTTRSFKMEIGSSRSKCYDSDDSDADDSDGEAHRVSHKDIGLGLFTFTFEGKTIHALHQTLGDVVGTNCGPALMRSLCLMADSANCEKDIDVISRFADTLIAAADATSEKTFAIYRWDVQHQYWRKTEVARARSVASVVLPAELKSKIVDDIAEFSASSTKSWYSEHGVPYKRSYLLHGSPGAGKTSLIQALAGKFKRNVCFMSNMSHPLMTDDNLKQAVQRVPSKSILVLEDIDAIFSGGRRKRDGDKSALTFSGVLNALDGVGGSSGQIFILTTNHRERLDPALIRNGRVDTHIEFSDATPEQMRLLFAQFYKDAPSQLGEQFASSLEKLLGEHTVSMAALQHYFTMQRRQPAEVAACEVQKILDEAEAHGMKLSKKADAEAEVKANDVDEDKEDDDENKGEEKGEEEGENVRGGVKSKSKSKTNVKGAKQTSTESSKEVHVHVHVD